MAANRHAPAGAPATPVASAAQYLSFMLGGTVYAIGILGIKEIVQYADVTGVPGMPDFMRGVINLRGAVLPVVDLGARFGRGVSPQTRRSCIVIMEVANGDRLQDVGVMVDAVNAVLEIGAADITPPPAFGARVRAEFVQGMGRVDGRIVVILDIGAAISLDETVALAELVTQLAAGDDGAPRTPAALSVV